MLRATVAALLCGTVASADIGFVAHRPEPATWRRTQCGGPKGDAEIASRWAADVSPKMTPLAAYPRPQMVRGSGKSPAELRDTGDSATWANLNGLWEWEPANAAAPSPPFGRTLNKSIMVPFPVESCLSGVAPNRSNDVVKSMWYRLTFDIKPDSGRTLLHFGAVDWQTSVYLNKHHLGNNTGGFNGFSFDVTKYLQNNVNEVVVYVFDPSDSGKQPNGKQRISAIDNPSGDTYTPSSGIWQTVWVERVPESYIKEIKINQASSSVVSVQIFMSGHAFGGQVRVAVTDAKGKEVAVAEGQNGNAAVVLQIPSPSLWSPDSPTLYDLKVSAPTDEVLAYFGLRTFNLGKVANKTHPLLNGKYTFLAGFLDQSWWPDGQYTAPSDEALEYDLHATRMFGLNMIRLHQKVNPERWYYHADRHGVVVFQDMPQKYGGANNDTVQFFLDDLKMMLVGRGNHPSIVQWTLFNEGDCHEAFNKPPYSVQNVTEWVQAFDPFRLVDTNSGGSWNDAHFADVYDTHSYPDPGDPQPMATQYAMVGEFGGIGAVIKGKEWVPGTCTNYDPKSTPTPADQVTRYLNMAKTLMARVDHVSASVYTQTTDLETECDGFLNYDRSNKFSWAETKALRDANLAVINASRQMAATWEHVGEQTIVI